MSLKRRVDKLEQAEGGPLPWLMLQQDLDDSMLYHGDDGRDYRRGTDDWPDDERYTLIVVEYVSDWRGVV